MTSLSLPRPPAWMEDAACSSSDPEAFFPDSKGPIVFARRICNGCPVRAECLEYALKINDQYGMYGGKSPMERRAIKRRAAA